MGRLLPDLDPGPRRQASSDGPGAHTRLVSAIAEALTIMAVGTPPGMIWLDDLQWADSTTLEALSYLARRLRRRPLILLLTRISMGTLPSSPTSSKA